MNKPTMSPLLRQAVRDHNRQVRSLTARVRAGQTTEQDLGEMLNFTVGFSNPQAEAERIEYNRQVNAYNDQLRGQRAASRVAAQARQNRSEVAQARAAACPRCFSTHPGEC